MPSEYSNAGGLALGFGNGGIAAYSGLASVRANPAMLAVEQTYTVQGSYHWPAIGEREFFQAGVVDSKTSNIAAGFTMTKFLKPYDVSDAEHIQSPLQQRSAIGFGQVFGKIAAGLNAQYVQGKTYSRELGFQEEVQKGFTIGIGFAGLLTPSLRFGVSAENLNNGKVAQLAPRYLRGGIAYLVNPDVTLHLDYTRRQRVEGIEYGLEPRVTGLSLTAEERNTFDQDEQAFSKEEQRTVVSFSARVYNLLRVLGAYGYNFNSETSSLAGGLALVNGSLVLSMTAEQPDVEEVVAHQALNLGFTLSL